MLKKTAFANSLAILTATFYLLFYLVNLIPPGLFRFLFNAQFMGAMRHPSFPKNFSWGTLWGALIAVVAINWIFGYVCAWLYNSLASMTPGGGVFIQKDGKNILNGGRAFIKGASCRSVSDLPRDLQAGRSLPGA